MILLRIRTTSLRIIPAFPERASDGGVGDLAKAPKVDVFNRGLGMFLEWGPAQGIDLRDRIARVASGLTGREIGKLVAEFERLRSAACRIVEEQVEKHQAEEDGRRRVAELDERISAKNASLLYHQARYSAWRDGFR